MLRFWPKKIRIIKRFGSDYDPQDVAVAFYKVAVLHYGENSLSGIKKWFNKPNPLILTSVKIGYKEESRGISGNVHIETDLFSADFCVCPEDYPEISCLTEAKNKQLAENFFDAIQQHLQKNSIYKGKAITANYEFLDLSGVDLNNFICSNEMLQTLQAHIWTIIEQPELCAKFKIKRQRKILLEGNYGAGKTFTALLTAKKAAENGWTFIYLPPTSLRDENAICFTFELARKFQPTVVFIEDIDHEQRSNNTYILKRILATVDGIISKNEEIIVVMTTNQAGKIDGALQRPGRIDKIIRFGELTAPEIKRLIEMVIHPEWLDKNIDWEEIAKYCLKYPPAFVREVATNALLCMITENKEKVTQKLLGKSAQDLEAQFKACSQSSVGFRTE